MRSGREVGDFLGDKGLQHRPLRYSVNMLGGRREEIFGLQTTTSQK